MPFCPNISSSVGMTKSGTGLYKSSQNISRSVGMTKSDTLLYKSSQKISSSVGMTKSGMYRTVYKSCQNISFSLPPPLEFRSPTRCAIFKGYTKNFIIRFTRFSGTSAISRPVCSVSLNLLQTTLFLLQSERTEV